MAPSTRSNPPPGPSSAQGQDDTDQTPPTPDLNTELLQQILQSSAAHAVRLSAIEERLEHRVQPPLVQPPPVQPPPVQLPPIVVPQKDPKLSPPPEFSGKVSEFRNFIAQCNLYIKLCPNTFNTDETKVLFIISRLRGTAFSWARDIAENEANLLRNDYEAFKTALSNVYLDRNYREICKAKLANLKQTKSAAAYYAEFAILVEHLNYNNEATCDAFYRGLHRDVKDNMALIGRPHQYDDLVQLAITIDQRNYQRKLESKAEGFSNTKPADENKPRNPPNNPSTSSRPNNNPSKANPPFKPTSALNSGTPKFESRYRDPLTAEEKARRVKFNLCSYCADPKHSVENCPLVAAKNAKIQSISFSQPRHPQSTPSNSPSNSPPPPPSGNFQPQAPTRTEA